VAGTAKVRGEKREGNVQGHQASARRTLSLSIFTASWFHPSSRKKEELKQEASAYVDDLFDNVGAAKAGDGESQIYVLMNVAIALEASPLSHTPPFCLVCSSGNLPGGVSPDDLSKLTSNQEIMDIVANPRLQELMRAVMEKDSAKMAEFSKDTEIMQLLAKFRELAKDSGIDPTKLS